MTTVPVAVAIGVVVGLLTGGSLRNITRVRVRSLWLLVLGATMQIAGGPVLVSYALLAAFAARNMTRVGMGVLFAGLALNAAPIVLDGGMPVENHAIIAAGLAVPDHWNTKRHLAHDGDHLRALDDTIPEWWTHEVLSFGDLVIAVGVGAVVAGLLREQPAFVERT